MKVSIITVCFNSAQTIRYAIESVINQDYLNIEYIIIDGGSTDDTLKIINEYKSDISLLVSEKDHGMYDAINKGIRLSSGDLIGLLHSDDYYPKNNVINQLVNKIQYEQKDSIYCDIDYIDNNNPPKLIRRWISGPYNKKNFKLGWMPPHPTLFIKKKLYEKYGLYNCDWGSAADYELIVRFFYRYNISTVYLPITLVKMRVGGISNRALKNRIVAHIYDWKAWTKNNISIFPFWVILKPLIKIKQFLIYTKK